MLLLLLLLLLLFIMLLVCLSLHGLADAPSSIPLRFKGLACTYCTFFFSTLAPVRPNRPARPCLIWRPINVLTLA